MVLKQSKDKDKNIMTNDKHMVRDEIEVLMASQSGEPFSVSHIEMVDKINELYGLNSHKVYDKFYVTLLNDKQAGWLVTFQGEREENKEETKTREAHEAVERKRVEDQELKLYLKLHKKYGKK